MPKPMIRIHITETNEVVDREMTNEEFDAYTTQKAIDEAKAAEAKQAEADKAAAKASALAKLSALGLTEDEVKSIVG